MNRKIPIVISISHHDIELEEKISWFLNRPGIEWIIEHSEDSSIPRLQITRKGFFLYTKESKPLFFHPSMALLRFINILRGEKDRYLEATKIERGDWVLDTTMGLASDSLVGAWAVGDTGKVIAIERSPIICALVNRGLIELAQGIIPQVSNPFKQRAWEELIRAAGRIEVYCDDHDSFLQKQPSKSYDVIYFDPMFRSTREQSSSIRPLHQWSNPSPLHSSTVDKAIEVARKRVVLKERKHSPEFKRLGFTIIPGGRYSPVDYGIISVQGGIT